MATSYILAPNARWQGRDSTGQPVQNGKLYTYVNQTTTDKATYQDYQGTQPNTNPVILDGKGEANIYWDTSELYTIKLLDQNNNLIYTQDNYPYVGSSSAPIVEESSVNIVRNEQFNFWSYGSTFSPVEGLGSQNNNDFLADDWLYSRKSSSYVVNITRVELALGDNSLPNNTRYFIRYEAATTPIGETDSGLYQRYQSVRTLAGEKVSLSFLAKCATNTSVPIVATFIQNFGTGGSPDVPTFAISKTLNDNFQQYSIEGLELPSVTGKTIGPNGDDALMLKFNYPNDTIATIDIACVQVSKGDQLGTIPFEAYDSQFKELNSRVTNALFTTGDVKTTLKTTADDGWLMCQDQTIGNVNSGSTNIGIGLQSLYAVIWNSVGNQYAPVYDSLGNITTRGTSAYDDFVAKKRLALTKTLGRVIASAGQAMLQTTFTADHNTELFTITEPLNSTGSFYTGAPVTFSTASGTGNTLPGGVNSTDTFYVINISSNTLKVATTLANAISGTAINLSTDSAGTVFITLNYSNFVPGETIGEQNHGLTINEMPAHTHPGSTLQSTTTFQIQGGSTPSILGGGPANSQIVDVASQGGSTMHNNMQPTVFLNYMIKI
jgi:hypothetical protein